MIVKNYLVKNQSGIITALNDVVLVENDEKNGFITFFLDGGSSISFFDFDCEIVAPENLTDFEKDQLLIFGHTLPTKTK